MAKTPVERVKVSLAGGRSYEVVIGRGVMTTLGRELRALFPLAKHSCLTFDMFFAGRWMPLHASLHDEGMGCWTCAFDGGETCKTWTVLGEIVRAFCSIPMNLDGPVITLGGGTLGDAVGLAAALYRRGVPLVQCPTTLLAMVDASVGGKTGINIDIGTPEQPVVLKNMAGVFHQPQLVMIDVDYLGTLPARHIRAGLAECIKHGMIASSVPRRDVGLGAWTLANMKRVLAGDADAQIELITRNVRLKVGVVEADEFETASDDVGGRVLLNLGHTFGHAIETLEGLTLEDGTPGPLLHGEAVGLGLVAASVTARELGLCDVVASVESALRAAGLPRRVTGLPEDETLLARMASDKKTVGGTMRLILPTGEGTAAVVRGPDVRAVRAGLNAIRMRDTAEGIKA